MKRSDFVALAATLVGLGGPPLTSGRAQPGPYCARLTKEGAQLLFDFELPLLDGEGSTFRLADQVGHPVWACFLTTWCAPCNDEAADMVRLAQAYAETGLRVVGIDVREQATAVRGFRDRHHIDFPLALDEKGVTFHDLGFHVFPTHVFLRADGHISCVAPEGLRPQFMDNELSVITAKPGVLAPPSPAAEPSPATESSNV